MRKNKNHLDMSSGRISCVLKTLKICCSVSKMIKNARISECGKYRYWLERRWGEGEQQVFVMLNPSIADASVDDPTIRRCIGFAKREGAGGIVVVNLFAYRATNPKDLGNRESIVGEDNESAIREALAMAVKDKRTVICAWGANKHAKKQAPKVKNIAKECGAELVCLGLTSNGSPRHPLYVAGNTSLVSMN